MKTIGVGIIGWGFMGQTHAHALRAIPLMYPGIDFQPRLAAVCSRDGAKARRAAEQLDIPFHTDDYRNLLSRGDVDVVSICTPNDLHESMAIDALRAGKHVYLDKPLAETYESALRIAQVADECDARSQMVFNYRFFPSTLRAKQMIDEGKLGQTLSFHCRYLHSGSVDPNRPVGWKQRSGAGVLQDLGSHALDLVTWLLGDPAEVFCALRTLYPSRPDKHNNPVTELADDQAMMLLRLPNGALGSVEASKIATGSEDEITLEIYGDKGALRIEPMRPGALHYFDQSKPEQALGGERGFTAIACNGRYPAPGGVFFPPKNAIGWDRAHIHCYYSFLDCLANGRAPSPSIHDGLRIQRLMDLMVRSNECGTWVPAGSLRRPSGGQRG